MPAWKMTSPSGAPTSAYPSTSTSTSHAASALTLGFRREALLSALDSLMKSEAEGTYEVAVPRYRLRLVDAKEKEERVADPAPGLFWFATPFSAAPQPLSGAWKEGGVRCAGWGGLAQGASGGSTRAAHAAVGAVSSPLRGGHWRSRHEVRGEGSFHH